MRDRKDKKGQGRGNASDKKKAQSFPLRLHLSIIGGLSSVEIKLHSLGDSAVGVSLG